MCLQKLSRTPSRVRRSRDSTYISNSFEKSMFKWELNAEGKNPFIIFFWSWSAPFDRIAHILLLFIHLEPRLLWAQEQNLNEASKSYGKVQFNMRILEEPIENLLLRKPTFQKLSFQRIRFGTLPVKSIQFQHSARNASKQCEQKRSRAAFSW